MNANIQMQSQATHPSLGLAVNIDVEKPADKKADTTIQTGAKVICVNARGLRRRYRPGPPEEGQIYCVREVYQDNACSCFHCRGQGILLVGVQGPAWHNGLEAGFLVHRFRWVHE